MSRFFDIQSGLQQRLNSVPGHPKIVYLNDVEYSPSLGTRYWRVTIVPLRSEIASVERLQKHRGKMQVDVFVNKNTGTQQLMEDLDAIYDKFNSAESIETGSTKVYILGVGYGPIFLEESWCRSYAEIEYLCYSL